MAFRCSDIARSFRTHLWCIRPAARCATQEHLSQSLPPRLGVGVGSQRRSSKPGHIPWLSIQTSHFLYDAQHQVPSTLSSQTLDYMDTRRCDMWAFACIFFYFLAGRLPFKEPTDYLIFQKRVRSHRTGSSRKTTRTLLSPQSQPSCLSHTRSSPSGNDLTQLLTALNTKNHPLFTPITDWKALWTVLPPTLEAWLYKRSPPDPNSQSHDIGWANWAGGDAEGEEEGMDEPPPDHIVQKTAPEVVGVRVTRDEDVDPAATNLEAPEAVAKSSLDGKRRDAALPLQIIASQAHMSTTGETKSVGTYLISEGHHGPWNSAASGGGNASASQAFELVRGMKGLRVDANSSSSSAEWHLANG